MKFAKFLEDGAREVCLKTADDDAKKTDASLRRLSPEVPVNITDVTLIDDATAKKNLVTLSLRMWGDGLQGAELDTWAASFKQLAAAAKKANKPREAWGSICIAMLTDPRFITY